MSAVVEGLHRTPARRAELEPLVEAAVVADYGIEGDHHAKPGTSRQVMLIPAEVLDDLDLKPGQVREQLCVRGLDAIRQGDVLEIGAVRLEVVKPRNPCTVMDGVRPGLRRQLKGRAGWCLRVVAGGVITVGDAVTLGRVDDPEWLHDFRAALAEWELVPPPEHDRWGVHEELTHCATVVREAADALAGGSAAPLPGAAAGHLADHAMPAHVSSMASPPEPNAAVSPYRAHDAAATAFVEAARHAGAAAEPWARALAEHYRQHATR